MAVFLLAAVSLAAACARSQSIQPRLIQPPAPLTGWRSENIFFAAVTVERFGWRQNRLRGWKNSATALRAAWHGWLGLPAEQSRHLAEPDRSRLAEFLGSELPALVAPDGIVLLYLGTHQLRDGRILLAAGESCTAAELAAWLEALPRRKILFTDVCYAAAIENSAAFTPATGRIHGGPEDQRLPELDFNRAQLAVARFFRPLRNALEHDFGISENRFSLAGMLLLQSLHDASRAAPHELAATDLFARFSGVARDLQRTTATYKVPLPQAAGLQAWPLARRGAGQAQSFQER